MILFAHAPEPSRFFAPPLVGLTRMVALECRAAPRHAVQACAVIDPAAGAEDYARALIRALQGATDRRIVFWQPGAQALSFDERWLLALDDAILRADTDSMRFLLARRVSASAIPVIQMLLIGLHKAIARG